ncbi:DUF1722 domain-containing protein [Salibacterium salarium]|uniref:DUF1722 domain-containing protein n=1 Tax=Salibacterium salarium TaxID=284579 RepID=A0A428MU51_9BACI|nr:DUF1722 domain-containing protein [Salibacterium salarium]RSL29673.1 DUF1722 domain-containing protein [Salibacterium salarium]
MDIVQIQNLKLATALTEKIWAANKYDVMAKGYQYYKFCSSYSKSMTSFLDTQLMLQNIRLMRGKPYNIDAYVNTMEHMWGYIKKEATTEEKETFHHYLNRSKHLPYSTFYQWNGSLKQAYCFFHQLLQKYPNNYLKHSGILFPEKYSAEITNKEGIFVIRNDRVWKII